MCETETHMQAGGMHAQGRQACMPCPCPPCPPPPILLPLFSRSGRVLFQVQQFGMAGKYERAKACCRQLLPPPCHEVAVCAGEALHNGVTCPLLSSWGRLPEPEPPPPSSGGVIERRQEFNAVLKAGMQSVLKRHVMKKRHV